MRYEYHIPFQAFNNEAYEEASTDPESHVKENGPAKHIDGEGDGIRRQYIQSLAYKVQIRMTSNDACRSIK